MHRLYVTLTLSSHLKVLGYLFRRHDGENLVCVPEFRIQAGQDTPRPPTLGLGLRLQCRFSVSRYGCVFSFILGIRLGHVNSASSDHTARLWEMASGETVRQYNGHHKGMDQFWAGLSKFL